MNDGITRVIPGDTLTLTLRGKVAEAGLANTPQGTTVKIYRPATTNPLLAASLPSACRVDLVLEADATVEYDVKSRWKNGVHIDAAGRYWMRRPDGWHEMKVADNAMPNVLGGVFAPPDVQRLHEDKG